MYGAHKPEQIPYYIPIYAPCGGVGLAIDGCIMLLSFL